MPKKRKLPEWRSIKVHSDVYDKLRAQQRDIQQGGWRSVGRPDFDCPPTLSNVLWAALQSVGGSP
jgi:hypothetical protein